MESESEVQEMLCGHFQQNYDAVQAMIMKIGAWMSYCLVC